MAMTLNFSYKVIKLASDRNSVSLCISLSSQFQTLEFNPQVSPHPHPAQSLTEAGSVLGALSRIQLPVAWCGP